MTTHEFARILMSEPDVLLLQRADGDEMFEVSSPIQSNVVRHSNEHGTMYFDADPGQQSMSIPALVIE